jgi:hypothetical protein
MLWPRGCAVLVVGIQVQQASVSSQHHGAFDREYALGASPHLGLPNERNRFDDRLKDPIGIRGRELESLPQVELRPDL